MPEIITNADAQYAYDIVKQICTQVGPGLPGSSQEWERAAVIKKELEEHLGADNVVVEEFSMAPDAFLNPCPALFLLISALLNISIGRFAGVSPWLTILPALLFSIISPVLFVFEFLLGSELIDSFFPNKQSLNVIGTLRKPGVGNTKRLLLLSGHHDSALENTWLRFLGYGFYFFSASFFIGVLTMLAVNIIQLAGMITGNAAVLRIGTLGWVLLAYPIVPSIIFGLFSTNGRKNGGIVPGAVDNLSACAITVALCRFLVRNPSYIPDDTEIRFVSFGSEEAGLRGSRRYVRRHLDELKRLDARMLDIEMVAHPEIAILTSDKNGVIQHSAEMVKSVVNAAQRAGVPYRLQAASLGTGTDAASFTHAGLKATTLIPFKMPQQFVAFYHQRWDGPQNLTIEPLLNVLKLTLEWASHGGE
jgi:hypothetical protein